MKISFNTPIKTAFASSCIPKDGVVYSPQPPIPGVYRDPFIPAQDYAALLTQEEREKFLKSIDSKKNIDLLPVSFSACVINRVNRNGAIIDTATALDIADSFIYKFINLGHNRKKVVGTILHVGFSEFGTDVPLKKEQLKDYTDPFNIVLGGVIWRLVDEDVADIIADCSDPDSKNYLAVSASWELGYDEYEIVETKKGLKNLTDTAKFHSDKDKLQEFGGYLKNKGGQGFKDEIAFWLKPVGSKVMGLGIGLTESPAADVKGVFVIEEEEGEDKPVKINAITLVPATDADLEALAKNKTITSTCSTITTIIVDNSKNSEKLCVNTSSEIMKLQKIEDITDESIKTLTASTVSDYIADRIKEGSAQYVKDKEAKELEAKAAQDAATKLTEDLAKIQLELEKTKTDLTTLSAKEVERVKQETFNTRMASFDEKFELVAEDRKVISDQIKDLDQANFEKYQTQVNVLLSAKLKSNKQKEIVASETVVDDALKNAKTENAALPNSPATQEKSHLEKYAAAFAPEKVLVK